MKKSVELVVGNNPNTDIGTRERIQRIGEKIAPVTMTDADADVYGPVSLLFLLLRGMSIQDAEARASHLLSKISQDRIKSLRIKEPTQCTIFDQQIAIAQLMDTSIFIVQGTSEDAISKF